MTRREQVLNYVNRLRDELGLKPIDDLPKSIPGVCDKCVIADALSTKAKIAYVYGDNLSVYRASDCEVQTVAGADPWMEPKSDAKPLLYREHPKYVADFIKAFDKGRYPDLIKKGYEDAVCDF